MRVLIVPEVYRLDDASSSGTLNDAVSWVGQWLRRDETIHVYWLLPPRERANYDESDVLADRERVTLVEAEPFMADHPRRSMFTENGYTEDQLTALEAAIHKQGAYVDVVVDQLRTGRFTLKKWLLDYTDHWAAQVRPFDVVANVHDLQVPFKYRFCRYRDAYQMRMELCGTAFADGIWFTAGIDAAAFREHASEFLRQDVVESTLDGAIESGSPVEFDEFEERYGDEPEWLHVAGSLWSKKHADDVLAVAETLYREFGVRTLMTSMEPIPDEYRRREWVDVHSKASRETYEWALETGDIAVCASEYETMARTPFEQAASGQVLLLRDEPWIYDCVPEKHSLVADADSLESLAVYAVEHWDEAVAANRGLVEYAKEIRSPERCGHRTLRDLRSRVESKVERYTLGGGDAAVERALEDEPAVEMDALAERTAEFTDDGRPVTARESYARTDLLYALRSLGYEDCGNPGTPTFRRTGRWT
ncbi:hypothetical protein [Haladaptatus halobius]|uniref:hypothetical protein n=1 Tax=Haladaptatus halobius TaxID=2884875 RepID=UPI001D0B8807|nr:hypothetical protein [Haladaptatus halobius]